MRSGALSVSDGIEAVVQPLGRVTGMQLGPESHIHTGPADRSRMSGLFGNRASHVWLVLGPWITL